ncbi:lytic murein transglycosylase [Salmonella enterica]|nr:lytic murein transglycosylase [Salmonella enterica]
MGARLICLALALTLPVMAAPLPDGAIKHLPALVANQRALWPDAPFPDFLAGQIEQESCINLKHSRCWNPRAELKTARENGVGFGQFTRAYNPDGSIRFDVIDDLSRQHPELYGWSWETRYNASYQLKAIILMDRGIFTRIRGAASDLDRLSMTLSAYNGGESGLRQDRRLCANTPQCDQNRWKGNVELTSLKAKAPRPGYGKSFFKINREYVTNILDVRRQKYQRYFEDSPNG